MSPDDNFKAVTAQTFMMESGQSIDPQDLRKCSGTKISELEGSVAQS